MLLEWSIGKGEIDAAEERGYLKEHPWAGENQEPLTGGTHWGTIGQMEKVGTNAEGARWMISQLVASLCSMEKNVPVINLLSFISRSTPYYLLCDNGPGPYKHFSFAKHIMLRYWREIAGGASLPVSGFLLSIGSYSAPWPAPRSTFLW